MSPNPTEVFKSAVEESWRRGILNWKLFPYQLSVYEDIQSTKALKFVLNIARRFGKTTILMLDAIEQAIRHPGIVIPYVAPTQKMIRRVIRPIVNQIMQDAPVNTLEWNNQEGAFRFANGSKIFVAGTDNGQYESLRGINIANRGYIDEAGFCKELEYIVTDILTPATMTGGGRLILSSTPPASPAHDFYFIAQDAKSRKNYILKTIDDNSNLSKEQKEQYFEEAGGASSTTARREYFCEFVTDTSHAVLPEFDDEREKEIVFANERPKYFQAYEALDPGFKHFTGYLIGYYDFQKAVPVIEDEAIFIRKNTTEIAEGIKHVRRVTFGGKDIYRSVADTDLQVIHDLNSLHQLRFTPTRKDDKEAAINNLRVAIQNNKIIIHPRCTNLVRQCKTAIWKESRKDWEESEREGHFDLLAALIYFVRNIDKSTNPYPAIPEWAVASKHWIPDYESKNQKLISAFTGLN